MYTFLQDLGESFRIFNSRPGQSLLWAGSGCRSPSIHMSLSMSMSLFWWRSTSSNKSACVLVIVFSLVVVEESVWCLCGRLVAGVGSAGFLPEPVEVARSAGNPSRVTGTDREPTPLPRPFGSERGGWSHQAISGYWRRVKRLPRHRGRPPRRRCTRIRGKVLSRGAVPSHPNRRLLKFSVTRLASSHGSKCTLLLAGTQALLTSISGTQALLTSISVLSEAPSQDEDRTAACWGHHKAPREALPLTPHF
ncbi:hypothetical protein VOLCADRAFT_87505 [Volvox carteri f. nagariensis]|uniref:Uncharacterized protein n=1 Tax=Volvox carteri f. nagariensis TaxID=3068 RepID=D8TLH2_VOLCA|nr:uncharacterized protein VOLCADRAFT_87505 [Volvox carteri f. nagariensis]EFJ51873.1 hypothetical protein VOLCADRAFT_87505 [Volvox carteri f. nagariensis]|eukprot:XP_002947283.1 hypothetical protein VOLCADRAFT_87505 [Volvox carteri f. nagariensis]